MTKTQFGKMFVAMGLAAAMMACGQSDPPTSPATTTPPPSPAPPAAPTTGGTLSGIVFEVTPSGNSPVEGVEVYCDACGPMGHSASFTTNEGRYRLEGAPGGTNLLLLSKAGYNLPRPDWTGSGGWMGGINATVNGETRFDIEVVRQQ